MRHTCQQPICTASYQLMCTLHAFLLLAFTSICCNIIQVFYHLGELDDALSYALGAGKLFDINERSEYVQTTLGELSSPLQAFPFPDKVTRLSAVH